MSIFANVYTGATANDGTGDSLRVAFQKIDQNFANIELDTGTSPVMSVAGRQGNIQLYVNDVQGAASNIFVISQTAAANAYTDTTHTNTINYVNNLVTVANTAAMAYTNAVFNGATLINTNLATLNANIGNIYANLGVLAAEQNRVGDSGSGLIGTLGFNINLNSMDIANLKSNVLGLQSNNITVLNIIAAANAQASAQTTAGNVLAVAEIAALGTAVNTAITTANVGMKSYVDSAVTMLTANAAGQSVAIANLTANSTSLLASVANLQANAVSQESEIHVLQYNANITAGQIITANAAVVNYVNDLNSAVTSKINAANAAIVTANTALKSYTDNAITVSVNSAIATLVNSAPGMLDTLGEIAANLAQEGSAINALLASLAGTNANVAGANAAIATVNTNWQANATVLYNDIVSVNAAIGTANVSVVNYVNTKVAALQSNAASQETEIANLTNSIAATNSNVANIATANISLFNYVNTINSNVNLLSNLTTTEFNTVGNYIALINANVAGANSAIVTANTAMAQYVNTVVNIAANTGNISFNNYSITTKNDTNGNFGITLNPVNGGEIHLDSYTGINNTNPNYWLEVGNWSDAVNTGNIAVSFGNPGTSYHNTAIWTWDWFDAAGVGHTNNSSSVHATFGLWNWAGEPGSGINKSYITFDANSASVVAPIRVASNTAVIMGNVIAGNITTTGTTINSGVATTGNVSAANGIFTANITTANITLTGNTGAPANTTAIKGWARVTVGTTAYWTPLYQ